MILIDVNGERIYPAMIEELLVVPAGHTPGKYLAPTGARFAIVAERSVPSLDASDSFAVFQERRVVAWFAEEIEAVQRLENYIAFNTMPTEAWGGIL